MTGFRTLFYKEWLRFWKVKVQTVLAPVLTALLYLLVFAHTLRGHVEVYPGVEYAAFLVPGLAMTVGGIAGAQIGARIAQRVKGKIILRLLSLGMAVAGIQLIRKAFGL